MTKNEKGHAKLEIVLNAINNLTELIQKRCQLINNFTDTKLETRWKLKRLKSTKKENFEIVIKEFLSRQTLEIHSSSRLDIFVKRFCWYLLFLLTFENKIL